MFGISTTLRDEPTSCFVGKVRHEKKCNLASVKICNTNTSLQNNKNISKKNKVSGRVTTTENRGDPQQKTGGYGCPTDCETDRGAVWERAWFPRYTSSRRHAGCDLRSPIWLVRPITRETVVEGDAMHVVRGSSSSIRRSGASRGPTTRRSWPCGNTQTPTASPVCLRHHVTGLEQSSGRLSGVRGKD